MKEETKDKIQTGGAVGCGLLILAFIIFGMVTCVRHGDEIAKDLIHGIGKDVKNIKQEFEKGYNDTTSVGAK